MSEFANRIIILKKYISIDDVILLNLVSIHYYSPLSHLITHASDKC